MGVCSSSRIDEQSILVQCKKSKIMFNTIIIIFSIAILMPTFVNADQMEHSEEDCFSLSVNGCDCDVVYYCSLLCEDRESSYDGVTETCCCTQEKHEDK